MSALSGFMRAQLVSLRTFVAHRGPLCAHSRCTFSTVCVRGTHSYGRAINHRSSHKAYRLRPIQIQTRALAQDVELSLNALKRSAAELETRLQDVLKVSHSDRQHRIPQPPCNTQQPSLLGTTTHMTYNLKALP